MGGLHRRGVKLVGKIEGCRCMQGWKSVANYKK